MLQSSSAVLPLLTALIATLVGAAAQAADEDAEFLAPPYPPSPVIKSITFAPNQSITRQAIDSDNWPMTWADDDYLYTSYGDGRGFEPHVAQKLSLGLARIEGGPENYKALNLRSRSAERKGDGPAGAKASGLLCVNGVLYMWIRNTGNSTLAWSEDHGQSWTWGFTFDESFGCPAFINYGRNYAGAVDDYVYVYSQDGPSAYESYDGVVLARVKKGEIREREAYEFFVKLDESGQPVWSSQISRRGHVFSFPKHCERLDAIYHPTLNRYLLTLGFGHNSRWGIFDAPAPWGPWTTAFITDGWDLPSGHGYRLNTKWMSEDGLTLWLVFSGKNGPGTHYDAFCVRQMQLELR